MKITIVQGAFFPVPPVMGGAVEKVWAALGKEFSRREHYVTHFSRRHWSLPDADKVDGVHNIRVRGFDTPASPIYHKLLDLIYSFRVLRLLPEADILVTNTFWLPIIVRKQRVGGLYVHVARYPKGQMKFYGRAARIQTVTCAVARAIKSEAPQLSSKVRVIPYPVIAEESEMATCPAERFDRKVILFVGRIHPEKGLELLIRAYAMLPEAVRGEWRLVIVGSAEENLGGGGLEYFRKLQEIAYKEANNIEWMGAIFDSKVLAGVYRQAMLFIYPSLAERGETFGLAPLEAMANGCAPLVSSLDCFRDYVEDGKNGYVFNHRDKTPIESLAKKMEQCIKDVGALKEMGKSALLSVDSFSMKRVAEAYLEDFSTLLRCT